MYDSHCYWKLCRPTKSIIVCSGIEPALSAHTLCRWPQYVFRALCCHLLQLCSSRLIFLICMRIFNKNTFSIYSWVMAGLTLCVLHLGSQDACECVCVWVCMVLTLIRSLLRHHSPKRKRSNAISNGTPRQYTKCANTSIRVMLAGEGRRTKNNLRTTLFVFVRATCECTQRVRQEQNCYAKSISFLCIFVLFWTLLLFLSGATVVVLSFVYVTQHHLNKACKIANGSRLLLLLLLLLV